MDITIVDKGNRWNIVPNTDDAKHFLMNETGAVPYMWKGNTFVVKKDADGYGFLEYLRGSTQNITLQDKDGL